MSWSHNACQVQTKYSQGVQNMNKYQTLTIVCNVILFILNKLSLTMPRVVLDVYS